MEPRVNVIKPVILKAGIPLAVTVAGFIWAKVAATRRKPGESLGSTDSEPCNVRDGVEEEVLGLRRVLESLQEREWRLETRFLRYCELRDREALLFEIGKVLELELGRFEAVSREVSSLEAEHRRAAEIVLEYVEVLEEMRCLKSENDAVLKKVKKISRKVRGQTDSMRGNSLRIEAHEREISTARLALDSERDVVKKMEGEIGELRRAVEQLRQEKDELRIKLGSVEESVLKTKQDGASIEDFKQLLKELELLQKEQAAEEKELIYLRWSNACLRHEMLRSNINHQDDHENHDLLIMNTDSSGLQPAEEEGAGHRDYVSDQEGASSSSKIGAKRFSKRKRLLQKLRRWVEGNGSDRGHDKVRFGSGEVHCLAQARRSCSSA